MREQAILAPLTKPTPESSTQEVLVGLVERVTFHNAENGFCVLRGKARGHRDLVTVVGHAAIISAGELITASFSFIAKLDYLRQAEPIDGIGARLTRPRDRIPYGSGANPDSPRWNCP
jgi:hypothetical protein